MTTRSGVLRGLDYGSPLVKYRGEKVLKLVQLLTQPPGSAGIDPVLAIDTYYALYLPAPLVDESSGNELSKLVVKAIISSETGQRLRAKTVLDNLMSTIASVLYLVKLQERSSQTRAENGPKHSLGALAETAEQTISDVLSEVEDVSRVRLALEGFEPGTVSVFTLEDYSLELLRLAREADVKAILDVVMGIRDWRAFSARNYRRFKRGEKLGYEHGADIERMSPRNLLYGEDVFYTRLAEGRLLLYSKVLKESAGPLYVLLDKSGSMEGEKMTWAKAVALAVYIKAIRARREFCVRFFDSQPYNLMRVSKNPKSSEAIRVFEYLARVKSAGGTDITRALLTALADIEQNHLTGSSVVLITDGIDRVSGHPIKQALKKTRSFLVTVMVKGDNTSLAELSTEYLKVVKLDREEILKVVKALDKLKVV